MSEIGNSPQEFSDRHHLPKTTSTELGMLLKSIFIVNDFMINYLNNTNNLFLFFHLLHDAFCSVS